MKVPIKPTGHPLGTENMQVVLQLHIALQAETAPKGLDWSGLHGGSGQDWFNDFRGTNQPTLPNGAGYFTCFTDCTP